jgi:GTP-binding protein LepA
MEYTEGGEKYILNLIDTPGHIDFSYEVSRALHAVEGVLLLVDATQGVQAQTLTTLSMAREQNLVIIPVLNKIDSPLARLADVKAEMIRLLDCSESEIVMTSGRTGEGVEGLLSAIIERIPPPKESDEKETRSLVFDFQYSNHRGVIVFLRVFDGSLKKGDSLRFAASRETFLALEVGVFKPGEVATDILHTGEIGYVVTGIKRPGVASVGDTIMSAKGAPQALPGYMQPKPVVWASVYPESQDDFPILKQALERLRLSDSSLSYEEETSSILGRGFRCGFLGMLHLEIITERLRREFNLELIVTLPSIIYEVFYPGGKKETIYSPSRFPEYRQAERIMEPWVNVSVITPPDYVSGVMQILYNHEAELGDSETFPDGRTMMQIKMPLRELMRNFFDTLKSVSSGFASVSYEIGEMREADVARLDILVAEEMVPAFCRVVAVRRIQEEAEAMVERLYESLPRQMFLTKIQAVGLGRILSSKTLSAMKKELGNFGKNGGDVTRKMKLLEKQKKGKKKMLERGKVHIPHEVFLKVMRGEER